MNAQFRKFFPESLINAYHYVLAYLAAFVYGFPSEKLMVIGVTGTNGKSTTVEFIGRILESAGNRVGWTGTASFKVADREWVNDQKMTMLGRFQTQKLLRQMVSAGCQYAIVETSSQGISQSRHIGINYDIAVFTNLTPEHIEAHGGFENYKKAKGKLFRKLKEGKLKKRGEIQKTSVVNLDDSHAEYFLSFDADKKIGYGIVVERQKARPDPSFIASDVQLSADATRYTLQALPFVLHPLGRFNLYNALAAISACRAVGLSFEQIQTGVSLLKSVPGRLESINEGQPFSVIVDYAYEPAALTALYDTLELIRNGGRLIHVLGSAGGGRDVARREILGRMAGEHADVVVVTNEDPYDEEPEEIMRQVAAGVRGTEVFEILDRQEAINKAVELAKPGDMVLITGKGCEPVMAVANGKKIPWDDREAVRRSLKALGYEIFNR